VEAKPVEAKTASLDASNSSPNQATTSSATGAVAGQAPEEEQSYRLNWRRVETGRGDGLRVEITSGLQAGTRVVALPEQLEAMGFEPVGAAQHVANGKSNLEPNKPPVAASSLPGTPGATPEAAGVSETAMPTRIVVHLTPALT